MKMLVKIFFMAVNYNFYAKDFKASKRYKQAEKLATFFLFFKWRHSIKGLYIKHNCISITNCIIFILLT